MWVAVAAAMRRYLFLLAIVTGCTIPPTARIESTIEHPLSSGRIAEIPLGERIELAGRWSGECTKHVLGKEIATNLLRGLLTIGSLGTAPYGTPQLFGDSPGVTRKTCEHLDAHTTVTCIGSCVVSGTTVTATGLGRLRVVAKVARLDTGDVAARVSEYRVIAPTSLALHCRGQECNDDDGVPAARPYIRPRAFYGAREIGEDAIAVNGRVRNSNTVSLTELFPAARTADGGIEPGLYPVVLSLGGLRASYQVRAR